MKIDRRLSFLRCRHDKLANGARNVMISKRHDWKRWSPSVMWCVLFITVPSLATCFLVLELFTTFVIPGAQFPYYHYDSRDHILKFSTMDLREGLYTIGNMAQQRARWRINNDGWNSEIDFEEGKQRLRIAIIGDSYVEALQVNVEDSLAGRLRSWHANEIDVYAFGISGAALSQYLQMSRYARAHFHPDIMVFNVVHNDFDESLCSVKRQAGMLCLEEEEAEIRESAIEPYHANKTFRVVGRSSLIRYAVTNLKAITRVRSLLAGNGSRGSYNANIDVHQVHLRQARIKRATEYILDTLKRENPGLPIIVMMDAPRHDIYAGSVKESSVTWMNHLLEAACERVGFQFVDLTAEFERQYRATHVRFESEWDWHWNEVGHISAARALQKTLEQLGLLQVS